MKKFLISVVTSLVVAIIYGIIVAQRESQIRAYLRASSRGVIRWLYVRALFQAVRGDAAVATTKYTLQLLLLAIFAASIVISHVARDSERDWAKAATEIKDSYKTLAGNSDKSTAELRQQLDAIKAEHDALNSMVTRSIMLTHALGITLYCMCYAGWILWMPFALMRARFAHEVAQFSMRIQGLASPEELATLTMAELAVDDTTTLKHYVQVMKEVATKRGINGLTRTLDLWG